MVEKKRRGMLVQQRLIAAACVHLRRWRLPVKMTGQPLIALKGGTCTCLAVPSVVIGGGGLIFVTTSEAARRHESMLPGRPHCTKLNSSYVFISCISRQLFILSQKDEQ